MARSTRTSMMSGVLFGFLGIEFLPSRSEMTSTKYPNFMNCSS